MHKFKVKCSECKPGASTDQRLLSIFCKCRGTGYIEISLADAILKYENLNALEIVEEKSEEIFHGNLKFYNSFLKYMEQAENRTVTFNVPVDDTIHDFTMSMLLGHSHIYEPVQIRQQEIDRIRRVQRPGEEYDYARYANEARAERIRRILNNE